MFSTQLDFEIDLKTIEIILCLVKMGDSFEDSMDMFDSDSDSLDSSNVKDATYQVKTIDEITHKMEQVIQTIVSSTEVSEFI